jgi:nucleotide-binding universal stress UspA family protein
MFKKILFPTDFSTNSNHALQQAIRLLNLKSGEIIVQHVVSDYFKRFPHWTTMLDVNDIQKHMDIFVHSEMEKILTPSRDGLSLRRVICRGKPAEEICALAEKELVDVVVMGSARAVVTNSVIRATTRPVLAVPAVPEKGQIGHETGKPQRILVATDFSPHSERMVRYAFELGAAVDANMSVMHVIETTRAIEFAFRQHHYLNAVQKMKEWAFNQLTNMIPDKFLHKSGNERIVEQGAPSERIAAVADKVRADLVIVGAHVHGAAHRRVLGTTTDGLLTTMLTPVLTVRL